MEPKKHPKANLEKKRVFYFQIALTLVLLLVLFIFEYRSYEIEATTLGNIAFEAEFEEDIENTFREKQPPPPALLPPPVELIIVADDQEVDEVDIADTESDEETEIEPIDEQEEEVTDEPFISVEEMPQFKGCNADVKCTESKMIQFIAKHVKYPPIAKENNITGRVYISFVVDKTGLVTQVKVVRSIDQYLDAEALRVVKLMPRFKAGRQRGKPVNVRYNIPINFTLN